MRKAKVKKIVLDKYGSFLGMEKGCFVVSARAKPTCRLCGECLTVGLRLRRRETSSLFLCYGCYDLVRAILKDELEEWIYKEGEKA